MKQTKHSHIKQKERMEIAILLGKGHSLSSIAKALERSSSTLPEEIKRSSMRGTYNPLKANYKACVSDRKAGSRFALSVIYERKAKYLE